MLCITLRVTFVMVLVIVSSVGRNLALPWRTQMDCTVFWIVVFIRDADYT